MTDDSELINNLRKTFNELDRDLIFVHSDVKNGFSFPLQKPFNKGHFLNQHFTAIKDLVGSSRLWFPAFNYDFPKTKFFHLKETPSQVGHLSEYVRLNIAGWRTIVPVFSITGTGPMPIINQISPIDPFGKESIFHLLVEEDGLIFNYGCDLNILTIIHYSERISGTLNYRYFKEFNGEVYTLDNEKYPISCKFHVRPLNKPFQYDWEKLKVDLINEKILIPISDQRRHFDIIKVKDLAQFWYNKLNKDPYYFLLKDTINWIKPSLEKLNRPFTINDFEK